MKRKNIRILLVGVLIVIALAVVLVRGDQLRELLVAMEGGSFIPLVLAIIAQFGKYTSQAFAGTQAFKTVGDIKVKPFQMLPLVFASYFMNVVAPSFNTAGLMLVIDFARKRGVSAGRATSAMLLLQISVITGFLVIMIIGFAVMQFAGRLTALWFFFGLIIVFFVGVMVAILLIGYKNLDILVVFLNPIARLANRLSRRFRKGKELPSWVLPVVKSFSEAAGKIREKPLEALRVFAFSVLASTFELCCFCLVGLAFGLDVLSVLIGGYVVATLFSWVAITPQGVGVVEAMIVVALTASRINAAMAATIAIVYRGIVFWMPFLIGAVLIHRTGLFSKNKAGKGSGEHQPDSGKNGTEAPESDADDSKSDGIGSSDDEK